MSRRDWGGRRHVGRGVICKHLGPIGETERGVNPAGVRGVNTANNIAVNVAVKIAVDIAVGAREAGHSLAFSTAS